MFHLKRCTCIRNLITLSYNAGTGCAVTTGKWTSAYDNVATTLASDLDIVRSILLKATCRELSDDRTGSHRAPQGG